MRRGKSIPPEYIVAPENPYVYVCGKDMNMSMVVVAVAIAIAIVCHGRVRITFVNGSCR